MKFLRDRLDQVEPLFHEGGKLQKLYPLYEAADTFLYTPADVTKGASHVRDGMDLKRMMIFVVIALTPCILMACYNTGLQTHLVASRAIEAGVESGEVIAQLGWRASIVNQVTGWTPEAGQSFLANFLHGALFFFPVFLVCNIVGGTCEVIFCIIRKHEINEGFLVTGMLFPLTLPASIPLWQVGLGIAFGVIIGKEIFGGTGKNFLNPALTARAFLYFAYPIQITGSHAWAGLIRTADGAFIDGVSCPTMLTQMGGVKVAVLEGGSFDAVVSNELNGMTLTDAFLGFIPGSMGETSTLACLLGAIFLIASGVGSWRTMAGVLIGSMGFATVLHGFETTTNAMYQVPPLWHLCSGGLAFGLVFMATDPVSSAMTNTGRWIYGLAIGVMTMIVRVLNPAFAEGIMLAILMGNVFAPVIDYMVVQSNIKRRLARNNV
ncbi:MAG: NADH:ubiquinone reductase (Na(+)-transporting) subunit B [Fuerstiella sp.]